MATINWGGSGIEKVTYDYIVSQVPFGSKILEFGAGYVSTKALMPDYDLISVDHQLEYAGINPKGIYAPKRKGWYKLDALPYGSYDLIILDGLNRPEFLKHWQKFPSNFYLIHDTYRPIEFKFAYDLAKAAGKNMFYHEEGDYFAWLY